MRDEETWRLILDCRENEGDWGEALWKVMNISDEFMEHLNKEEGLYFRSAITTSSSIDKEDTKRRIRNQSGPRELIPWLGKKEQLETLLGLLYQNQIISNPDIESMISSHFWDAKNKKRYDFLEKGTDEIPDMIPWTGTQAQLKKLFSLLAIDAEGRMLEWDEIRNTVICEHFFNEKMKQPFNSRNLKRLVLNHANKENLELIHNLLEEASEA